MKSQHRGRSQHAKVRRRQSSPPALATGPSNKRLPAFVPLSTPRLSLSALTLAHAPEVFAYAGDPAVARTLGCEPLASLDATRHALARSLVSYAKGGHYEWAIVRCNDGALLGSCELAELDAGRGSAELGYVLAPRYFGQGYATEACSALLRFAFVELELLQVEAQAFADNDASLRVLDKLGLRRVEAAEVNGADRTDGRAVIRLRLERERFSAGPG